MTQDNKNKRNFNRRNQTTPKPTCKECNSTDIKSRSNFSHGNKSKSRTSYTCNNCGSSNIDLNKNKRRY